MQGQTSGYSPMPMQTVTIMPPPPPSGSKVLRCLSIVQIIIGIIVIFCGILANGILDHTEINSLVGAPIWGGCWIMVTGVIGISFSLSGTFIAFNVISTVLAFSTMMFAIAGAIYYNDCDGFNHWNRQCNNVSGGGIVLYLIVIVLVLTEFVVSITAAAFSCKYKACCCCAQQNQDEMAQTLLDAAQDHVSTGGYPISHSNAYYTTSGYPQHTGAMAYPGQMVSQQPPASGACATAQGQQMPAQTYSSQMVSQQPPASGAYATAQGQQMPAQTNIVYSAAKSTDFNTAPPPYNSKDIHH